MVEFIEINTIGVSKDSQVRAARILKVISDGYEFPDPERAGQFFHIGRCLLADRWQRLRQAVDASGQFSLPRFSVEFCRFFKEHAENYPGIYLQQLILVSLNLLKLKKLIIFLLLKVLHG